MTWALLVAFEVTFSLLVRLYYVEAFKLPADSMMPNLLRGDYVYVTKFGYTPKRGDIAAFGYPRDNSKNYIKRILALGGDTIDFLDGRATLNGMNMASKATRICTYPVSDEQDQVSERSFTCFDEQVDGRSFACLVERSIVSRPASEPVEVPDGHVYVVGDNRDYSADSRIWGPISNDKLIGKAMFIWFSSGPEGIRWDRIGKNDL